MTSIVVDESLQQGFRDTFGREPVGELFSPGRVNLIGEHIDYCGGQVLPMAIGRGTRIAWAGRDRQEIRVYSKRFDELATVTPASHSIARGHWSDYVAGVGHLLDLDIGVDIYVTDDIACGGLSSSASFSVGIARTLYAAAGKPARDDAALLALARVCRRAENEFVGVPCGIMDQASVALGGVVKLDCSSLQFQRLDPGFGEHALVIMDTGRPRTLAASAYATRVDEIRQICDVLGDGVSPATLCRDVTPARLEESSNRLPAELASRLRHVVTEQSRVEMAFAALARQDFEGLGRLMQASHASLRDDYEVTGPELDAIVAASLVQPGVLGARMTGAGFGGCAIALVRKDKVASHNAAVIEAYKAETGLDASLFEG